MAKRKTYKLNHETLLYEIKEVSKRTVFAKATLVFLASVALAALYFFIYTVVLGYDSPKTVIMKKTNARWETRLELMNRRLDAYEEILGGLESRNGDVYRSIFGMDNMPAGVFGSTPTGPIDESLLENVNPNSPLARTARRLDAMTRQVFLQRSPNVPGIWPPAGRPFRLSSRIRASIAFPAPSVTVPIPFTEAGSTIPVRISL